MYIVSLMSLSPPSSRRMVLSARTGVACPSSSSGRTLQSGPCTASKLDDAIRRRLMGVLGHSPRRRAIRRFQPLRRARSNLVASRPRLSSFSCAGHSCLAPRGSACTNAWLSSFTPQRLFTAERGRSSNRELRPAVQRTQSIGHCRDQPASGPHRVPCAE